MRLQSVLLRLREVPLDRTIDSQGGFRFGSWGGGRDFFARQIVSCGARVSCEIKLEKKKCDGFLLAAFSSGQNTRLAQLDAKNLLLLRFKLLV